MKKRILALITAAAMVLTMVPAMAFAESEEYQDVPQGIELNAENFPDDNFRSEIRSNADWNDDGYLSDSEIMDTTELYAYESEISDLTGIEFFENLQLLNVRDNKLTTIDVSMLKDLEYLVCSDNQLTSLNLEGLTNLECLICSGNKISSLDLSDSDKMYVLEAQNNQLSKLVLNASAPFDDNGDYDGRISVAYNNFNDLNDIQFNGNPVKEKFVNDEWDYTYHPQNWVKSVTINETNFPDPVLREELSDEYNDENQDGVLSPEELTDIEYLYMSDTMLEDLTGINYLFALEELSVDSCYITELPELPSGLRELSVGYNYLTNLPALPEGLRYLSCSENQLTSLPALPATLETLYCSYNQLTSLPVLPAALRMLSCYENKLTALPSLPAALEELSCGNNALGSLPALPAKLTSLSCGNNKITKLPTLPATLTELSCGENKLTSLPVLPLKLQRLSASYNEIGGVVDLSSQKFLTDVNLYDNRITGVKLNPLAKYDHLDVSDNAMKSTADVTGRDDIVWEESGFWFNYQKSVCELNGHKYVKEVHKASFNSSGWHESVCSVCDAWKSGSYVSYGYVKTPKNITKAYTGSVLAAPKFVVKTNTGKILKQGTDYTVKKVTSAKLKNVGKYKYKITLQGAKYKGFTYAYVTVNPKATVINKLTKPAKRQIKVTWQKRTAQVTGYQIRYSGKQSMAGAATVKVKSFKTNTKTIKNLKAKKKYWVQVRTYKNVNGKTYYSAWSAKKSITTK